MRQAVDIVLTTITAVFIAAFATAIAMLVYGSQDNILLITFLMIGNIFMPTLLAVFVFQLIKKTYNTTNSIKGLMKQSVVLLIILIAALILWAALDVIFSDVKGDSFLSKLWWDFSTQFLGFLPATVSISFAIPSIDYLLNSKSKITRDRKTII